MKLLCRGYCGETSIAMIYGHESSHHRHSVKCRPSIHYRTLVCIMERPQYATNETQPLHRLMWAASAGGNVTLWRLCDRGRGRKLSVISGTVTIKQWCMWGTGIRNYRRKKKRKKIAFLTAKPGGRRPRAFHCSIKGSISNKTTLLVSFIW